MKHKIGLLVACVFLCLAATAFATELTWDQTCKKKTSAATTLYVKVEDGDGLTATSTLAAGTYIRTTGETVEGKTGISYSANNRDPLYGYIDGSVIVSATKTITLQSGTQVTLPEALVRSKAALDLYLEMEYGETTGDSKTYIDENGQEQPIGDEKAGEEEGGSNDAAWATGMAKAAIKNGAYTRTVYKDDEGNETEIEVVYMGLARSMIVMNGEQQLVDTWRLEWETEAPEDKVLAVVDVTGKTGYAKLHAKSSKTSLVMCHVTTNRVLRVIATGKNWTLVDIDEGPRGYIATVYLSFYPNLPMEYRGARLSVNGKLKGKNPTWIRAEDKRTARLLVQYDPGMPLTVYACNEKWAEVDVGGYHGYLQTKFVTFDEPEPEEAPEEEQTASAE